jgi:Lipocalin-like domain
MKTRCTLTLGAIAAPGLVLAISSTNALAQQKSPVVGTWQVTSFSILMPDTNEVLRPFAEHPIGYLQYSPGGHMVTFCSSGAPQRAAGTAYTDAERIDIYRGICGAYAGTHSVEGNKVIRHIVASWFPEWNSGDQTRYAEIEGNRLTIKTAPQKASPPLDGRDVVATATFERVE